MSLLSQIHEYIQSVYAKQYVHPMKTPDLIFYIAEHMPQELREEWRDPTEFNVIVFLITEHVKEMMSCNLN